MGKPQEDYPGDHKISDTGSKSHEQVSVVRTPGRGACPEITSFVVCEIGPTDRPVLTGLCRSRLLEVIGSRCLVMFINRGGLYFKIR